MVTPINAMSQHKLEVVKGIDGFEGTLVKNLKPSAAQEVLFPNAGVYAGRCMSRNSAGETELGCAGRAVPMWQFRTSNLPSTGYSDPISVDTAVDLTQQDGREHRVLYYVGIEGLELITTEYIVSTGTAYAHNQFLKAPPASAFSGDANIVAGAGVVTNAAVVYGKDAVIGVVSELSTLATYRVPMLQFFSLYRPPIEGLAAGLTEPAWA